ncbi:MAG: metallophosphoesterase [bacterium]|nr:metallophosphoesterase [bacterium]
MTTRRDQALGAFMFVILVLLGWAPFVYSTAKLALYDAPAIMLGGIFAILAAGLTYDAADRLLGAGKGVYAAAILASFVPSAIVLSEPPLLSASAMMFVTAAAVWFAARATADTFRESLFFVAILNGLATALYGLWVPASLPFAALILLRARFKISNMQLLIAVSPAIFGLLLKNSGVVPLPDIAAIRPDISMTLAESLIFALPWAPWLLALLFVSRTVMDAAWPRWIGGFVLLSLAAHFARQEDWVVLAGAVGPLVALCVGALLARWFAGEPEGRLRALGSVALLSAAAMMTLTAARFLKPEQLVLSQNHAVIALLAAVLLTVAFVTDARRLTFGLLVGSGLVAGALWWQYPLGGGYDSLPQEVSLIPWLVAAAMLVRGLILFFYGRHMPRKLRQPVADHSFEPAQFRLFQGRRRAAWPGTGVAVEPRDLAHIRFAIFGDVAGSEFPFSSRESGYSAFGYIVKELNALKPDFAVSTGDLAARATPLAYRRLRVMLRRLSVPLMVTPGNHDYVQHRVVHAQYFRALFGSDHGDVTMGPIRLILLNNSWGSLAESQFEWVTATLARSTAASHTVVFCHKPIFDPREGTYYGMENRTHAQLLHGLFAKHGVRAVFSGHIHSLLTTEHDGVTYVISGGGGSKLKTSDDMHHYLWCEVTSESLDIKAVTPGISAPLLKLSLSRQT